MKYFFFLLTLIFSSLVKSQTLADFQAAVTDPNKKIQGLHKYPENIEDGQCHNVEIISIVVSGNKITILEHWKNYWKNIATTTLTGTIDNNNASGAWESTVGSGGTWSYNFATNTGQWNKTRSSYFWVKIFKTFQPLKMRIVNNGQIRDGAFECD